MGFFLMIISILLAIFFISIGIFRKEHKRWNIILIVLGIVFILIAIYLGLPR